MADYSRPSPSTPDFRRPRSHIPCPRCRIDPSHVYRPYWESNSPAIVSAGESTELRSNGYPDLCPPSRGNRQQQQQQQPAVPPAPTHQPRANPNQRYIHTHSRSADSTFSTRPGDTWRIRGVLENHQQPDVTRRIDSTPGPLPDVTRHSATSINNASTSHSRIPSGYEAGAQSSSASSRVTPQASGRFQPSYSNNPPTIYRDIQHTASTAERNTNERASTLSWKREHQCSNPWVARNGPQNTDRRPSQDGASLSCVSGQQQQQQQQPTTSGSSHIDTWRPPPPPPQHVLSQCPLPDLVTPRRQARKQCCGLLAAHSVAVRWLVVAVAALGLLCSVVGTVVGVVRATGRDHLTVSLLLIGLGIVLVSMSGVAWRLTARDAPSCRAMFGLRRTRHEPHRRFVPRVPHYGRPHPFSAMLYPDIPLRPPPPSYQASMQEYRLRLLLMDRQQVAPPTTHPPPPPSYRGPPTVYPRFPINIGSSDYSRPPSYRSRPSSAGQPSPVGTEELTPDIPSTSDPPPDVSMLTVLSTSTHSNSSQLLRPPPSTGNNHIEVVAQV